MAWGKNKRQQFNIHLRVCLKYTNDFVSTSVSKQNAIICKNSNLLAALHCGKRTPGQRLLS